MTAKGEVVPVYTIYIDGVLVKGRHAYEWYVLELREVPCENCDDGPKKVAAYQIKVDDQLVYVPESMCVDAAKLPFDFNSKSVEESVEDRTLGIQPADALKEYEEAFGITKAMIYTPDIEGLVNVKHETKKQEVGSEDEQKKDLSRMPFIY